MSFVCLLGIFSEWSCFKGQWTLPQISRVDFIFVTVNIFWLVMSCLIITLIKCLKKAKSMKDCSENVYYKNECAHMCLMVIMLERYKAVLRHICAGRAKIKIKIGFFLSSAVYNLLLRSVSRSPCQNCDVKPRQCND